MSAPTINLIRGRKPHFLDHFISWALTIGRVVVIATEAIALSAFLYRFGLDRQLVDLRDKIAAEENIVKFLKKNEDTYRNLQGRIALANNIIVLQNQTLASYSDIIRLVPPDLSVQTFLFSQDDMKIEASMQSLAPFTKFINNLKAYPTVATVSIDKIENQTETGTISISLTATFKKVKTEL